MFLYYDYIFFLNKNKMKSIFITILPIITLIIGIFLNIRIKLSSNSIKKIENFMSGLILGVLSFELAPKIYNIENKPEQDVILFGLVLGILLMIVDKFYIKKLFSKDKKLDSFIITYISTLFTDGLLNGTYTVNHNNPILSYIFAVNNLFHGITISEEFKKYNISESGIIIRGVCFSLVMLLGTIIGINFTKDYLMYYGVISFGIAILIWSSLELYLKDNSFDILLIYVGFIYILLFQWRLYKK